MMGGTLVIGNCAQHLLLRALASTRGIAELFLPHIWGKIRHSWSYISTSLVYRWSTAIRMGILGVFRHLFFGPYGLISTFLGT